MRYLNTAVVVAVLCVGAIAIVWQYRSATPVLPVTTTGSEQYSLHIGGVSVPVDIADTPALREQGLSGRPGLASGEGILFIFPEDGVYKFWMKDMLFSIDMIWISQSKEVVYIKKNVSPETYPDVFGPDTPVRYVLEVPAGFSDAHNVSVGDIVGL